MDSSTTKKNVTILLLEECNFNCRNCFREDENIYPGYKLSWQDIKTILSDCQKVSLVQGISFTGGEPTLWQEDKYNLIDLLIEIAKTGFSTGFITNGSYFVNYDKCRAFFERYFAEADKPLFITVSMDTFHNNFNKRTKRASELDNLLKYKTGLPVLKQNLLKIHIEVVVSKEKTSLLPDDLISYYESMGISFKFTPLVPVGKGRALKKICPELGRNDEEGLGAFYVARHKNKPHVFQYRDRIHIFMIDGNYYLFSTTNKDRIFARLGQLNDDILDDYLNKNQDVKKWISSFIEASRDK
ncbi:MAG: radical SAM protein [Planctomycetota bacterium]